MKYFSTFSGIGGFELGIIQAYEDNLKFEHISKKSEQKKRSQRRVGAIDERQKSVRITDRSAPLCIGFSEIDKYAIQIYEKHFPRHTNFGDITKINADTLPDFNLLIGGFPCQSFSIAGKRKGFEDTRGTMFFELARILRAKQPELFVFENVKGLLSHDNGQTFRTIIATLDELGYDLQWQVLNSKNFGVPQNRERVFIVGNLRGTPRPKVFPITASNPKGLEELTNKAQQGYRVYDENGINPTLASQAGGVGAKTGLIKVKNASDNRCELLQRNEQSKKIIARTVRGGGRSSPHGSKQNWDSYELNGKIRRLTPKECERLQGFPDNWTDCVSDTRRYCALGNAVTTNVIKAIMERII